MEEYITDKELQTLMEDIIYKLSNNELTECQTMLEKIISDTENEQKYIDRTYIGSVKTKRRMSRIAEINAMLEKMSNEQVDNVHQYTVDEYDEPNHAAEALDAIMQLSRKMD